MYIGKHTNEYNDIYWAEGNSIEEILLELEAIEGTPVQACEIIFYEAIKVTVKTEYIIQE